MGRVFEDQVGEIDRGRRRVDWPSVTRPSEEWKPARMIEMGVGQNDRVQLREGAFLGYPVVVFELACALKEAEVHEDICLARLHQVCGSRDFAATGAVNCDLHVDVPCV